MLGFPCESYGCVVRSFWGPVGYPLRKKKHGSVLRSLWGPVRYPCKSNDSVLRSSCPHPPQVTESMRSWTTYLSLQNAIIIPILLGETKGKVCHSQVWLLLE